jgi:hypothetical protein
MEIRYTATPADIRAQLGYQLRHSARAWLPFLVLLLLPVLVGVVPDLVRGRPVTPRDWVVAFGIGIAASLWVAFRTASRVKRDERVLTLTPAGIRTTVGSLAGEVPWSKIALVGVTPEHIFVMGRNTNGFAIPERAFPSPRVRAEFVALLEQYRAGRVDGAGAAG